MAILDGARQLLAEGAPVTVAAAAERHGVSKATAYRYFSDPGILVSEAMLDIAVKPYEEITRGADDLRGRLLAINLYFLDLAFENEAGFRQFLGRTLTLSATGTNAVRRGARRISMYRQVLAEDDGGPSGKLKIAHLHLRNRGQARVLVGGRKDLDAAQWVGAVERGAEGSLKQLQGHTPHTFRPSWGGIAANLRR